MEADPTLSLNSARVSYYREKVVQCLVLANYTKCPPYTIETVLLYFGTEYLRTADTQFSVYVLVGMIIRMAFRMGYHRDPSRFSNISVFNGEMRRRQWLVIMSLDLVTSSQVGLPRMIQPSMYDTQEPGNFIEDDIHEDILELPASRPETELTELLYTIVLTRVRNTQAKIMDLMNSTSQPPYREIAEINAELRHVYDKVPEFSKAMPSEEFETAMTPGSMRRMYLGLSFLKAVLILHRPYLILGRADPRYEYSRRVCLNAAVEMLKFQRKLDTEMKPGGKLRLPTWKTFTVSWYMSSVVAQDFLLATTVLVLDLDEDLISPLRPTYDSAGSEFALDRAPPTREEIVVTLQSAYHIWSKATKRSQDARRVAAAVKLVLSKAGVGEIYVPDTSHSKSPIH
jgi:hypothetical protein